MLIRLTRKFAECIDGVDLSPHRVGQIIDLPERDASLLIAEGWAKPTRAEFPRSRYEDDSAPADDAGSQQDAKERSNPEIGKARIV